MNFTDVGGIILRHFLMASTLFPGPSHSMNDNIALTRAIQTSEFIKVHEMRPHWERLLEVGPNWQELYNDDPADLGLNVFDIFVTANQGAIPVQIAITPLNIQRNGLVPSVATGVVPNLAWDDPALIQAYTSWALFLADYQITRGFGGPARLIYTGIEVNIALAHPATVDFGAMLNLCIAAADAVRSAGKAGTSLPFSLLYEAQNAHLATGDPSIQNVYDAMWEIMGLHGKWVLSSYPMLDPTISFTNPVPANYYDLVARGMPFQPGDEVVMAEMGCPTENSLSAYEALTEGPDLDSVVWFWAVDPGDLAATHPAFGTAGLFGDDPTPAQKEVSMRWQADHFQKPYVPREDAPAFIEAMKKAGKSEPGEMPPLPTQKHAMDALVYDRVNEFRPRKQRRPVGDKRISRPA